MKLFAKEPWTRIDDNAWADMMARVTHTLIGSRGLTMVIFQKNGQVLPVKITRHVVRGLGFPAVV